MRSREGGIGTVFEGRIEHGCLEIDIWLGVEPL